MNGKAWWFGSVAIVVVMIGGLFVEQRAGAQARRLQVPIFEPDPLWSQPLPNKWVTGQVGGIAMT